MMDAFHQLRGTTGPQPPQTHQPDRLPAHSSRPQQSPPRTAAADGTYCSHQELPATAVQDAPSAELTIPSACSYQHLHTVLLQRPIEFTQYTAIRYAERLGEVGAVASVGATGDSYDNALAETTIGLLKSELLDLRKPWRGQEGVEFVLLGYVDWFNTRRIHHQIGGIPPAEFEAAYYAEHDQLQLAGVQ